MKTTPLPGWPHCRFPNSSSIFSANSSHTHTLAHASAHYSHAAVEQTTTNIMHLMVWHLHITFGTRGNKNAFSFLTACFVFCAFPSPFAHSYPFASLNWVQCVRISLTYEPIKCGASRSNAKRNGNDANDSLEISFGVWSAHIQMSKWLGWVARDEASSSQQIRRMIW